ncbi:hypothetical protein V8C42DRAFT_90724 [Trichoderma barbatum]
MSSEASCTEHQSITSRAPHATHGWRTRLDIISTSDGLAVIFRDTRHHVDDTTQQDGPHEVALCNTLYEEMVPQACSECQTRWRQTVDQSHPQHFFFFTFFPLPFTDETLGTCFEPDVLVAHHDGGTSMMRLVHYDFAYTWHGKYAHSVFS